MNEKELEALNKILKEVEPYLDSVAAHLRSIADFVAVYLDRFGVDVSKHSKEISDCVWAVIQNKCGGNKDDTI